MKKIAITTSSFGVESKEPLELLKKAGFEVEVNPYGRKLTKEETISFLRSSDGVIAGTEEYSTDVLTNLSHVKVISRCGAGTDGIDKDYMAKNNMTLLNTPQVHVDAVAELTLAGLLSLTRKIAESHKAMSEGKWEKRIGMNLSNKVVGIIGFGKVGRRFANLISGFNCSILAYDPMMTDATPSGVQRVAALEPLLRNSDVISLHMPGTKGKAVISSVELAIMKPDVIILNTSRGGLIDESALETFLKTNPAAGAYLDVFEKEPYRGTLSSLPNIVMTPHIGTFTRETRVQMEIESVNNIINYFSAHG